MKAILTVIALSSFIATPVVAGDLSEVMSGNAHQLSSVEMQQTVGASSAFATSINQATNTTALGTIFNTQLSTANATAVGPFFGSDIAQANSGNLANNLSLGGFINNFQNSNANAFSF